MKQKFALFAFLIIVFAIPQKVLADNIYYCAVSPSGHALEYWINTDNGTASVGSSSNLTGDLVIPNSITLPYSYGGQNITVSAIVDNAFWGCNGLSSVSIPNTITSIGQYAFSGCSGLSSISIPTSVVTIGLDAFGGCSGIAHTYYAGSIAQWCGISFANGCSNPIFYSHDLIINNSVVTNLVIPSNITNIGNYSFYNCTGITSVSISNTISNIGNYAFFGCSSLSSVIIPNSTTVIGNYSFSNCTSLETIYIPESVNNIGYNAFSDCTSLTSITLPNNISFISTATFSGCVNLSSVIFGGSISLIGPFVFKDCSNLTEITLPNTVASIGDQCFYGCTNLATVNILSESAPSIGSDVFSNNATNRMFNIPCGSYYSYLTYSSGWYPYINTLYEPTVSFIFSAESDDTTKGTSYIMQQHGIDVACDSSVIIRADSNYGYHFDHWSNGRTANPDTLFLTGDSSVTAFFSPNQYTLTLLSYDESLGSVSEGGTFNYLDTILIEATVTAEHYHFDYWSDYNTDNPRQYVITGDATLRAYFSIDRFTVTAVPNISERGSVNGGREYSYGAVCTLTAGAFSGYQFAKWSDGTTSNPYIFAVSEDVDLRALFVTEGEQIYSINVSSSDPAMGKVYGGGYAVNGDLVNLRAVSYPGYHFSHWSDNETDSTRTIEVHGNMTLTAHFAPNVGIADIITNNIRVFSRDRQIIVEGSEGMRIWVFDMMGRVIYNGKTSIIPIQQTGVYIVKVGNNPPRKVVVMR